MKKLGSYIIKYWYAYTFALICMVMAIVLDMMYPLISKRLVDDVIMGGRISLLKGLLSAIFLVGLGRAVLGYFKEFISDICSSRIGGEMRYRLFCHVQTLSGQYFDNTNTGELMARLKEDIDSVSNAFGYVGMLMLEVVAHVVIVLYCMFRLSPTLCIIPCIFMPIIAIFAVRMERKLNGIYGAISEENAVLNTIAEENLAGVRTVKAFAREGFEIQKFKKQNKRYYELNMKQSKILVKYQPFFQFVTRLLPFLTVIYGGILVMNGKITLGTLVAFSEYTRNIVWPMEMVGWLSNDLSSAVASYGKIKKIYEVKPLFVESENPTVLDRVNGDITFDHVSLTLDGTRILEDISFHVKAGNTIGIMGATGAGKSSIVHLLQRFHDVDETKEGEPRSCICLDGVDIREMSVRQVRESTAIVMQDIFLFSDTILENIRMGKRDTITMQSVEAAVEFAQARGFIEEMEDAYETVVGERGVGLSGGQKQRISIARAVAKEAPILVLDDSTSALDMETERQIQKELYLKKGVTKVIIAHRISAVRHADEIIFLENGRIAERGTHETLLGRRGLYYETYMAQYGEFMEVHA